MSESKKALMIYAAGASADQGRLRTSAKKHSRSADVGNVFLGSAVHGRAMPPPCRAMKRFAVAALLMLSCAWLGAQTPTDIDICDRTEIVETALLNSTPSADTCDMVLAPALAAITELDFTSSGITSLKAGDFSGLTGLRRLNLSENDFSTLPRTIFSELTSLEYLNLENTRLETQPSLLGLTRLTTVLMNSVKRAGIVSVWVVRARIELSPLPDGAVRFSVQLVSFNGVPRPVTAEISAPGAELSADSLTIPTGRDESSTIFMTRIPGSAAAALTVEEELALGGSPEDQYSGFTFSVLAPTVVTDICARTDKIEASILVHASASALCGVIPVSVLAAITKLNLSSTGILALKPGDFAGFDDLRTLNLADNGLTELPPGVFAGLTRLTGVRLSGNPGSTFTLTVRPELEPVQLPRDFRSATVKLVLREGAPRPITVGLSANGAELSAESLTIPTGEIESIAEVTITRTPGDGPFELTLEAPELGGADSGYDGIRIVSESPRSTSSGVQLRLRMFLEGALE